METHEQRIDFIRAKLEQAHGDMVDAHENLLSYGRREDTQADVLQLARATYEYRKQAVAGWQAEWDAADRLQSLVG